MYSQITRAADSVVLNIAEGSDRYSDKDFSRFLNQAIASLAEVSASLDIAIINNYLTTDEILEIQEDIKSLYKQLRAFCSKVRRDSC